MGVSAPGLPPRVGAHAGVSLPSSVAEAALTYAEAVLADSPIAYYRLADTSGTVAVEEVAGRNGTYNGAPTLAQPGPVAGGVAAQFDGVDDYMLMPSGVALALGANATVEFWHYVEDPLDAGSAFGFSPGTQRFQAFAPWSDGVFSFDCPQTTGRVSVDYTPYKNKWTHTVCVVEGTRRAIYLDGALAAEMSTASNGLPAACAGGTVGKYSTAFDRGLMSDFAVYNRALTDAEITAHYAAGTEVAATEVAFPQPALATFDAPTGTTVYVDSATGNDTTGTGTQAAPYATITKGVAQAASGGTVLIGPGVYPETVTTSAKGGTLTLRASDPDTRPIIDGEHVRQWCILHNGGALALTVEGLECRNATFTGIQLTGNCANSRVRHCVVHDIYAPANGPFNSTDWNMSGIKFGNLDVEVTDNLIYSIGQQGEARGILLSSATRALVARNTIISARKEGIRDAGPSSGGTGGLDNVIRDNVIALCWIGIASNATLGTVMENNAVMDCTFGFNPKHHYHDSTYWSGEPGPVDAATDPTLTRWCKVHHNTVVRSSHAAMQPAVNLPFGDFYSYQNNLMVDAGGEFLWEFPDPAVHGPNQIFDNNAYVMSGSPRVPPRIARVLGYTDNAGAYLATLADLQAWVDATNPDLAPYEANGQALDFATVGFNDYDAGDLDYTGSLTGADLGGLYGTQIGARGLTPPPVRWVLHNPVDATASHDNAIADRTIDDWPDTYWYVGSPMSEGVTFTFDLGAETEFSYFKLQPYAHNTSNNIEQFDLQVSTDGVDYTTLESVVFNDTEVSTFHYELRQRVSARYVRLANIASAEAPATAWPLGISLADFAVGALTLADDTDVFVLEAA